MPADLLPLTTRHSPQRFYKVPTWQKRCILVISIATMAGIVVFHTDHTKDIGFGGSKNSAEVDTATDSVTDSAEAS